jgi:hypothetical protein
MTMRTLLLSVVLAGSAFAAEPQCSSDNQCVITMFSGCCGGCCPQARAMSKAALDAQEKACATKDCAAPMCAAMVCEPGPSADSLVAKCSGGRCVAQPKPGSAECQSDRDCTVSYPGAGANDACRRSPCGCCPGTQPRAEPVAKAERESSTAKPRKDAKSPGYGLSQGNSAAPQPNCSPCPAPTPAQAVCRQNRCVLGDPSVLPQ